MPWTTPLGNDPIVYRIMFYERKRFEGKRLLWVFNVPFNVVRTGGAGDNIGGNTFLEPKSVLAERKVQNSTTLAASAVNNKACQAYHHEHRVDEIAPYDSLVLHSGINGNEEQLHKFCWWPKT